MLHLITEELCKEQLSKSYVLAVGSMAGLTHGNYDHDFGVDGFFKEVLKRGGRRCTSGNALDFQLKSTELWKITDGHIVYNLKVKNYNDLVEVYNDPSSSSPLILILLCLPQGRDSWLSVNNEKFILRNCCYWYNVDETHSTSQNSSTVTIKIPVENVLTPEALIDLMYSLNS